MGIFAMSASGKKDVNRSFKQNQLDRLFKTNCLVGKLSAVDFVIFPTSMAISVACPIPIRASINISTLPIVLPKNYNLLHVFNFSFKFLSCFDKKGNMVELVACLLLVWRTGVKITRAWKNKISFYQAVNFDSHSCRQLNMHLSLT
jgi:hypothetical protein